MIARAGQPLVEVRAVPRRSDVAGRIGFMTPTAREPTAPVKTVGADEVAAMFEGGADAG